jgi:hypothetical protein
MKRIVEYESYDGTTFRDEDDCKKYDELIHSLECAMDALPPYQELVGEECLQHTKGSVKLTRNKVIGIIGNYLGINSDVVDGAKSADHNGTIFGRYVDDSGNNAAYKTWSRFMAMSSITDKEYSQPYFLLKES